MNKQPWKEGKCNWRFVVDGDECGPYDTKAEAESDYRGLVNFYRSNTEFLYENLERDNDNVKPA